MNIEEIIETEYNNMFKRYRNGNHSWFGGKTYQWMEAPRVGDTKEKMRELINKGYEIKGGYSTTSVRGYHNHIIFYRKKK